MNDETDDYRTELDMRYDELTTLMARAVDLDTGGAAVAAREVRAELRQLRTITSTWLGADGRALRCTIDQYLRDHK